MVYVLVLPPAVYEELKRPVTHHLTLEKACAVVERGFEKSGRKFTKQAIGDGVAYINEHGGELVKIERRSQ